MTAILTQLKKIIMICISHLIEYYIKNFFSEMSSLTL